MKILRIVYFITIFVICCSVPAIAANVTLRWDASISPGVTGYKVYFGNSSRQYGTPITIGNQTTYTVTGLADGIWYFSVKAIDGKGGKSGFSNEVIRPVGNYPPIPCDINADQSVNELDLQALKDVILNGSYVYNDPDINHDGKVNAIDLQILNNVIQGLRTCP